MVQTKYGALRGIDRGNYVEYRGIPYAAPPVGPRRWRAPEPPKRWEGVYDATDYRNRCVQEAHLIPPYDRDFYADSSYETPMDEDCLYLHIWAPKEAASPAPVAVWYHGGAFLGGWSTEIEFDGAGYCARGVILVSVEYRCNVFGFLAHPWLSAESPRKVSGNYGILDQVAALRWVYENIAAFGGDPERITVFGQSAGAMSVQTLVSSELTEGMIAGAIMQSGGSYGSGLHIDMTMAQAEAIGKEFVETLGVDSPEALRALPAARLMEALGAYMGKRMASGGGLFLVPNVDGYVLKDSYYHLMEQGKIRNIPYILGSTRDDILVTPENRESGSPLYHGINAFGQLQARLGKEPCWLYYFTRALPGDDFGAWHSCELWYSFDTLRRCWRPWEERDYVLRDRMMGWWTNFCKYGDPNGEGLPEWHCATAEAPNLKELN